MSSALVVYDDRDTCCTLANLPGGRGYCVDAAVTGDNALEMARANCYDVGQLDFRMPCKDGLKLCRRLKKLCPSMTVMMVAGFAFPNLKNQAAGVQRVLLKPLNVGMLLALFEQALPATNAAGSRKEPTRNGPGEAARQFDI